MPANPGGLSHVTEVQQRGDNTISIYIQTDSFKPGQEVEVSAYLTQGNSSAFYNDKKRIPLPDLTNPEQPTKLHVELPAAELDPTKAVTVVTRVTEVWPTVLQQNEQAMTDYKKTIEKYNGVMAEYAGQGLKAVWTYQDPDQGPEGKAPGDPESPPPSNSGGATTAQP